METVYMYMIYWEERFTFLYCSHTFQLKTNIAIISYTPPSPQQNEKPCSISIISIALTVKTGEDLILHTMTRYGHGILCHWVKDYHSSFVVFIMNITRRLYLVIFTYTSFVTSYCRRVDIPLKNALLIIGKVANVITNVISSPMRPFTCWKLHISYCTVVPP